MAAIVTGDHCLLDYGEIPRVWHQRRVLHWVEGNDFVVVTPDFDVFVETLSTLNPDLEAFRFQGGPAAMPPGVDPLMVYGIRALTLAEVDMLEAEGARIAEAERIGRGLPPVAPAGVVVIAGLPAPGPLAAAVPAVALPIMAPVVAAAAAAALPLGLAPGSIGTVAPSLATRMFLVPAGGMWITDVPSSFGSVGTPFAIPAGTTVVGNTAIVDILNEQIMVRYLAAGIRLFDYINKRRAQLCDDSRVLPANVLHEEALAQEIVMHVSDDQLTALNISGPRTAKFLALRAVSSTGGSFISRHHRWLQESGIASSDRLVYEHEVLSRTLHQALVWDRLNIANLTSMEILSRRLQLLGEAVADNPDRPSFDGASYFMGVDERRGGALLDPGLRAHVAAEMSREAAIAKERRKTRENKKGD